MGSFGPLGRGVHFRVIRLNVAALELVLMGESMALPQGGGGIARPDAPGQPASSWHACMKHILGECG